MSVQTATCVAYRSAIVLIDATIWKYLDEKSWQDYWRNTIKHEVPFPVATRKC